MSDSSGKSFVNKLKASKSKILDSHEKPSKKVGFNDEVNANAYRQKKGPSWKAVAKNEKKSVASYKKSESKPEIKTFNKNKSIADVAEQIAVRETTSNKKNFQNADYKGSSLKNRDFSGYDLTGADFTDADLEGVNFTGAILKDVKFNGAKLKSIKFLGADIENVDFDDIDIDELSLEELQELIEYLAINFPEKLNLTKINLALLDLSKIDLSKVNLSGVDFTGVDFTGVNIMELDLSETNITHEQIAQALGRVPTPEELKFLLMAKKKGKKFKGIDIGIGPQGYKDLGVWNAHTDPKATIRIDKIMKLTKDLIKDIIPTKDKSVEDDLIDNEVQASKIGMSEHKKALSKEDIIHEKEEELLKKTIADKKFELKLEQEKEEETKEKEEEIKKIANDKSKKLIEQKKKKHLEEVRAKQKANDAKNKTEFIRIPRQDRGR
jgi:uncharacterized protein YjbI with pentapeptide repeats